MRKTVLAITLAALTAVGADAKKKPESTGYPITQVPFTAVKIAQGTFWGQRIKAARDVTIPLAFSKCESEGRFENFAKAAHPSAEYDVSSFMGYPFDDTDVYKTIEGASYVLQTYPDKRLEAYIDSVLDIVAAAQEEDGYLYTARTINPAKPHKWSDKQRWVQEEELSHELYNLGHMVDAACAHYQATGSKKFLDIARRYADCVVREVGPAEGQARVVPGHQIAEMALARLYVLTGERKYLDEAKFFLDWRGKTKVRREYSQSHRPVTGQKEAVGHAVRYGRPVFAVPGGIFSEVCAGTNRLLAEGKARMATGGGALLAALGLAAKREKAACAKKAPPLSAAARAMLPRLSQAPRPLEQLSAEAELDTGSAMAALLELELAGLAQSCAGGLFRRK